LMLVWLDLSPLLFSVPLYRTVFAFYYQLLLYCCQQQGTKHTDTRLTALCPGQPGWAGTRKVKPIWILLKQQTVSGCGISWAICKSAPRSRQITTPAPHHSVYYWPDALPAAQPTASKHWKPTVGNESVPKIIINDTMNLFLNSNQHCTNYKP